MGKKKNTPKVRNQATKKPAAKRTAKKAAPAKKAAKTVTATRAPARKPAAAKPPISQPSQLETDKVAEVAYLRYLERLEKGLPGDQESDWLAAENALRVA